MKLRVITKLKALSFHYFTERFRENRPLARQIKFEKCEGTEILGNDPSLPALPPSFLHSSLNPPSLPSAFSFYLTLFVYVSFSRPTPQILWYRNNVLITDSGDRFQRQLFDRTLRLGSLSSSVHDGSYKCVALNGFFRIETSFSVKVIGMNTSCETFNGVTRLFLLTVSACGENESQLRR